MIYIYDEDCCEVSEKIKKLCSDKCFDEWLSKMFDREKALHPEILKDAEPGILCYTQPDLFGLDTIMVINVHEVLDDYYKLTLGVTYAGMSVIVDKENVFWLIQRSIKADIECI